MNWPSGAVTAVKQSQPSSGVDYSVRPPSHQHCDGLLFTTPEDVLYGSSGA